MISDRLQRLYALRLQLDEEIRKAEAECGVGRTGAKRRSRADRPDCATEEAYQWHRYRRDLPLPAGDPCGCQNAHREHVKLQDANRRAARRQDREHRFGRLQVVS